jgi:hypothetical protein
LPFLRLFLRNSTVIDEGKEFRVVGYKGLIEDANQPNQINLGCHDIQETIQEVSYCHNSGILMEAVTLDYI